MKLHCEITLVAAEGDDVGSSGVTHLKIKCGRGFTVS